MRAELDRRKEWGLRKRRKVLCTSSHRATHASHHIVLESSRSRSSLHVRFLAAELEVQGAHTRSPGSFRRRPPLGSSPS